MVWVAFVLLVMVAGTVVLMLVNAERGRTRTESSRSSAWKWMTRRGGPIEPPPERLQEPEPKRRVR